MVSKALPTKTGAPRGAPSRRPSWGKELKFLVLFLLILGGSFTVISIQWVNDHFVEPFTGGIARASGVALRLLGQDVSTLGTVLRTAHFAVNVRNGCNGVEAMLISLAAVAAFPASRRSRVVGLALSMVAIQVVNVVRVVALFLTGVYFPRMFDSSHTVLWQTIVILCAVLLWVFWVSRLSTPAAPAKPGAP
jgi:exosortase H (IPTLxxWG-CTERM-specific)